MHTAGLDRWIFKFMSKSWPKSSSLFCRARTFQGLLYVYERIRHFSLSLGSQFSTQDSPSCFSWAGRHVVWGSESRPWMITMLIDCQWWRSLVIDRSDSASTILPSLASSLLICLIPASPSLILVPSLGPTRSTTEKGESRKTMRDKINTRIVFKRHCKLFSALKGWLKLCWSEE